METIYGPRGGKRPTHPILHSKWNLERPLFKNEFGFHRGKRNIDCFLSELRHIETDFKISKWILELSLYDSIYLLRSRRI